MDLDALVQEKMEADVEFAASIAELSDEEKVTRTEEKRQEIIKAEFAALNEKSAKAQELAENYKVRAEKAERAPKHKDPEPAQKVLSQESKDLSSVDVFALVKANVHEDDIAEVQRMANVLGIPVAQALKDDAVSAILKSRAEKRKTADAMNAGAKRPAQKSVTGKELLAAAENGDIPDAGTSEAEELFWARHGGKR